MSKGRTRAPESFGYLVKFCKYMRDAIDACSYTEVAVASYVILKFASLGIAEPVQTLLSYFNGMLRALENAASTNSTTVPMLQVLCRWSLYPLQGGYWWHFLPNSSLPNEEYLCMESVHTSLDELARLSVMTLKDINPKSVGERLTILEIYFRFSLDYYLALRKRCNVLYNKRRWLHLVSSLLHIAEEVSSLVPLLERCSGLLQTANELPAWPWEWNSVPDTTLLFLAYDLRTKRRCLFYGLAAFIRDGILAGIENRAPNRCYGHALARICAVSLHSCPLPSQVSALPFLFWAGIALSDNTNCLGSCLSGLH